MHDLCVRGRLHVYESAERFSAEELKVLILRHPPIRGRLHLRFECAVWMCSEPSAAMTCVFDVHQNLRPITLNAANIAESRAARRRAAEMRHHAARSAACVFEYSGQKQVGKRK
jgi:hypothetical protein